jgi:hypothetical protein
MNFNESQFDVQKVVVNRREFLSSMVDQNLMIGSLPGIRTVDDISEMPWPKIWTALEDNTGYRHPFKKIIEEHSTKRFTDFEFFDYKQRFDGIDYMVVLQDLNEDTECVGLGGEKFPLVLNDSRLKRGDFIGPVNAKGKVIRNVSQRPERYGVGWLYYFEYKTPDDQQYFDSKYLKSNTKWEKAYHLVGEGTSERGSMMSSFNKGWIQKAGNLATLSKETTVTDKAQATYLVFYNCYDKQQFGMEDLGTKIMDLQEAEFVMQVEQEKQYYYMWGRPLSKPLTNSNTIDESSSYSIQSGTGFFGYAAYSTTEPYHRKKLTSRYVFNTAVSKVNGKIRPMDYNFLAVGGYKFTEALLDSNKQTYGLSGFLNSFKDMTEGAKAIDTKNREGVAFNTKQFVKMNFDPMGSLTVGHWADLDSPHFFGPDLNLDGWPISSWWGFIFNLGLKNSKNMNIELIEKRNSEIFHYLIQSWGPLGPVNSKNSGMFRSNHVFGAGKAASYDLLWQQTIGFNMRNPEGMLWFTPTIS